MIVVDTNIIRYFFLKGEFTELAEKAFRRDPHWVAPLLWRSEFRNVLALCLRKGILSLEDATQIMLEAELLMKGNEYSVTSLDTFRLVSQSDCSAYDCEFVALARDLRIPMVTTDKQVLRDFPETTIGLDQFVKD